MLVFHITHLEREAVLRVVQIPKVEAKINSEIRRIKLTAQSNKPLAICTMFHTEVAAENAYQAWTHWVNATILCL